MAINLEYVIIGLLLVNFLITAINEHNRKKLTIKLAKQGNDSIGGFVKIFKQLDQKLKDALEVIDPIEIDPMEVFGSMKHSPIVHFHTMPTKDIAKQEAEEKKEQATKIERNIESYIASLKYARDNFAELPAQKKIVDALIKNIENHYGRTR